MFEHLNAPDPLNVGPFSDEFWWLRPEQQTDDKKKKDTLKKEIFGKDFKDPFGRFGRGTGFKAPPAAYGDCAFVLHILAGGRPPTEGVLDSSRRLCATSLASGEIPS